MNRALFIFLKSTKAEIQCGADLGVRELRFKWEKLQRFFAGCFGFGPAGAGGGGNFRAGSSAHGALAFGGRSLNGFYFGPAGFLCGDNSGAAGGAHAKFFAGRGRRSGCGFSQIAGEFVLKFSDLFLDVRGAPKLLRRQISN